ncbi:MAG: hypothetical protein WD770_02485 [Actinomycetota bacterium]
MLNLVRSVASSLFLTALGYLILERPTGDRLATALFSLGTFGALAAASFVVDRPRTERAAVEGWRSKVTEITPSERYPLWALLFRLYGPSGEVADGQVGAEIEHRSGTIRTKPGFPWFDDHNLQPDELSHYVAFFPESFEGGRREDGEYVLRWFETHGLSRRLLADPHRFAIHGGRVHRAKPE